MSDLKKYTVITSIFPPTDAIKKFSEIPGWHLIVVGDRKTPSDWRHPKVTYLGPNDQEKLNFQITKKLPWNHYCRKMMGYLYAINQGADIIADSDDDNEPLDNWSNIPDFEGNFKQISGPKFVNVYRHFSNNFIWPRGYPLDYILKNEVIAESSANTKVGIWQFLANGEPDVDAIYRLVSNKQVTFDNNPALVLDKDTVCPTNSQNTFFRKELFILLYLPSFVTFRFTDILRGLVAQPIMWANGYRQGFGPATVIQKRNPHNYVRDFESEIPVYLNSERVIDLTAKSLISTKGQGLNQQFLAAYSSLEEANIVTSQELDLLRGWIRDIESIQGDTS